MRLLAPSEMLAVETARAVSVSAVAAAAAAVPSVLKVLSDATV